MDFNRSLGLSPGSYFTLYNLGLATRAKNNYFLNL